MVAIHQLLPVFAPRDAIGHHTVAIRATLHAMGIESEIFAGEVNPGAGYNAKPLGAFPRLNGPTWLLYHASTGSAVAEWFADRPEPKLIDYHNITPAELMGPWEPHVGVELEHGRRQLADLAGITTLALADSSYNQRELIGLGYRSTVVVPILMDTPALRHAPDPATLAELQSHKGGHDWIFVSRVSPHKAQHDLIKAFAAYCHAYGTDDRLHLIGSASSGRYLDALYDFVDDLRLEANITLVGSVPDEVLGAYYRIADVYVSVSDHEGFGVPLIEAMANDVPVVAFASGAVPETVGDAGLVLAEKDPATVAAAVHRVLTDHDLRHVLVQRGRQRVEHFSYERSSAKLRQALDAVVRAA